MTGQPPHNTKRSEAHIQHKRRGPTLPRHCKQMAPSPPRPVRTPQSAPHNCQPWSDLRRSSWILTLPLLFARTRGRKSHLTGRTEAHTRGPAAVTSAPCCARVRPRHLSVRRIHEADREGQSHDIQLFLGRMLTTAHATSSGKKAEKHQRFRMTTQNVARTHNASFVRLLL